MPTRRLSAAAPEAIAAADLLAAASHTLRLATLDPRILRHSRRLTTEEVEHAYAVVMSYFRHTPELAGLTLAAALRLICDLLDQAEATHRAGYEPQMPWLWMPKDELDRRDRTYNAGVPNLDEKPLPPRRSRKRKSVMRDA